MCPAAESITLDLPIKTPLKLPARLAEAPQQVTSPDGTGYTQFSMRPAAEGEQLFVTIIFKEDGKNGLAIFWMGEGSQQTTLSENLADGVTGFNQRTLAIPAALASEAGKLVISGDQSKILRIRLDWVPASTVYVAADQSPVSFVAGDRLQAPTDLTGIPQAGLPDTWLGTVLDASLQEGVEEVQGSVGFAVPLDSKVSQVLFRVKLLGLPLDQSVSVWINGQPAGNLQPIVPPLSDAGYLADSQGEVTYAGWRNGALLLPASQLKSGENTIQIESKSTGVFIRDAALQLRAPAADPAAIAAQIPLPEDISPAHN